MAKIFRNNFSIFDLYVKQRLVQDSNGNIVDIQSKLIGCELQLEDGLWDIVEDVWYNGETNALNIKFIGILEAVSVYADGLWNIKIEDTYKIVKPKKTRRRKKD